MTGSGFLVRVERRHLDRWLLGGVVAVFAGLAVAYTRITPIGASPDELSHLHYINGIADHLRLPPAGEPERQQPPLYYLLGAIVAKLTGDDARLIRLVSVVLGVLTLLSVYAVARRLFPLRPALAAGAAALVALLPEAQYLAGAINDDNLAWLAGALLVLAGVGVMESDRLNPRLALGSPLPPLHPITAQRQVFDSLSQVRGYIAATALSIVGMYGNGAHFVAISILGSRPLPSTVAVAMIVVITIAACVAVFRSWARWDRGRRQVAILLLVVLIVAAVQSVLNSASFDLQPQARYLLVAAAAAAPITAWTIAWRRTGRLSVVRGSAIVGLVAVALLLDVSGLITAAHTVA